MKTLLIHMVGFGSAISLLMILLLVGPGAMQGDFSIVGEFIKRYPGSQIFLIFILPIVFICGPAWIIYVVATFKQRR